MYIGDYLGRRELYSPNKLAVVDHGKNPPLRLTYREMNERANRLAHWLSKEGEFERATGSRSSPGTGSST